MLCKRKAIGEAADSEFLRIENRTLALPTQKS
jgi:hypothetical protein